VLAWIYEYSGRPEQAIEIEQRYLKAAGATPKEIDEMMHAYRTGGMPAVRRADIKSYLQQQPPRFYDLAMLYAAVGDTDKTIDYLRKAYDDHDGEMVFLAVAKEFEAVRSDSRFRELLGRMRLPQSTS